MRCLITGASGFIGSHLAEARMQAGDEVFALGRASARGVPAGAVLHAADLLDAPAVEAAVAAIRPELVFHLAAQSLPAVAWRETERTLNVNIVGTLHLLDALRRGAPQAVIEVFGSSAEYAPNAKTNGSIAEDDRLEASNPYGLSKIAADQLCRLYHRAYAMNVRVVRPFFILGTRKTGDATSDFARGIVRVERGEQRHLDVGNLEAVRDFLDIEDALRAFSLLAERGAPGQAYNVCCGNGTRLGDLLRTLMSMAKVPVEVRPSPGAMRPLDEPIRVGNPERLAALGWSAAVPLERTLARILDYWRATPSSSGSATPC